jgi:small-conductance mechanosensitive channel
MSLISTLFLIQLSIIAIQALYLFLTIRGKTKLSNQENDFTPVIIELKKYIDDAINTKISKTYPLNEKAASQHPELSKDTQKMLAEAQKKNDKLVELIKKAKDQIKSINSQTDDRATILGKITTVSGTIIEIMTLLEIRG